MGWDYSEYDSTYSFKQSKTHRHSVVNDAVLSKISFITHFKTTLGEVVGSWLGQPEPFVYDRIDRLNRYIVPAFFLMSFSILAATVNATGGGEALSCLPSMEIAKDEYERAVNDCMTKNRLYVDPDGQISWSDSYHRASLLYYYVATFLLMQVFFFWLPSCIWNHASTATGIDLVALLGLAKEIDEKSHLRPKIIDTLAAEIEDSLRMRGPQRVMGLRFDSYVVTLYLLAKLLYIVNISAQFLLLNAFLDGSYAWWGWEVVESLITGKNRPCFVNANATSEKALFVIWWFLAFVAMMTALNLVSYLFSFSFWPFCCSTREDYVRFLCRDKRHRVVMWSDEKVDVATVQNFADDYLCNDGVLLFKFIENQAGSITAREVMGRLFDNYLWRREHPSKPVPDDIAYKTMNELEYRAVVPKKKAPKMSSSNSNAPYDQNTSTDSKAGQSDDETTKNDKDAFDQDTTKYGQSDVWKNNNFNVGFNNFASDNFNTSSSAWTPWNRGRGRRGNTRSGYTPGNSNDALLQSDLPKVDDDAFVGRKQPTWKAPVSNDNDDVWGRGFTNDSSAQGFEKTVNYWQSDFNNTCNDAKDKCGFCKPTLQSKGGATPTGDNDTNGGQITNDNNGNTNFSTSFSSWTPLNRGRGKRGGNLRPRVLFNTHLDTVPPFIPPSVQGDAIYGRGANDAKGQIASMIFALNKFAENRPALADQVGLLLTSGEETDHIGMIEANQLGLNPKFLVVGEPTELKFAVGQKGAITLRLTCSGKASHSGYPEEGESAVHKLLDLLEEIRQVEWPTDSLLGETTVNIGMIEGGQAVNALSESAHADIKIRVIKSADEVIDTIEKMVDGRSNMEVFEKNDPIQLAAPPGHYETCVVAFNTDIPFVKGRDFSKGTFLFGPGSILNAHSKDEHVRIKELEKAVEILMDLIEKLLSTSNE
ncbi:Peptidase dimerization domain containing protein [Aphelenchoides avenae]|nr:Peptidase dimerization domain containing protein [Aphelenchus avenae]